MAEGRSMTITSALRMSRRHKPLPPPQVDGERFMAIPAFSNYWISDKGRLWSGYAGKFLIPRLDRGHHRFFLYSGAAGRSLAAHRLVLEAFVGPCPPGHECCHNNSIPDDNRVENLRWDTPAGNGADRRINGEMPIGEDHKRSRLTEPQVMEILRLYRSKDRPKGFFRLMHERYGVSTGSISCITRGRNWRHLYERA